MNLTFIRNMDGQGRILIPRDIRKLMNWADGEPLVLSPDGDGLLLRKHNCLDEKDIRYHMDILFKTIHASLAVISGNTIVTSRGIYIPVGSKISSELINYLKTSDVNTTCILKESISATDFKSNYVDTIIPLENNMRLLLFQKKKKPISDQERMATQLVAALLKKG
jgi:AbrB family looped-hinge helix DNA binding protein